MPPPNCLLFVLCHLPTTNLMLCNSCTTLRCISFHSAYFGYNTLLDLSSRFGVLNVGRQLPPTCIMLDCVDKLPVCSLVAKCSSYCTPLLRLQCNFVRCSFGFNTFHDLSYRFVLYAGRQLPPTCIMLDCVASSSNIVRVSCLVNTRSSPATMSLSSCTLPPSGTRRLDCTLIIIVVVIPCMLIAAHLKTFHSLLGPTLSFCSCLCCLLP